MSHNPRFALDSSIRNVSASHRGKTTTASYTLDDNLIVYGDNTYRYDDDGYLVEKTTPQGTTTYTYNTLGALTDGTLPDGTQIRYSQDALSRRVAKEVGGTIVEKYLWEDLTTLLAIYDANGNLKQRFEYADARMPMSMTDANGTKYYFHYDQVGSLRAVSDANGNVVKEITYDTFGTILSDSNPSFKVPFGFAGGLYDADTKLTRFGYRDYDAYKDKGDRLHLNQSIGDNDNSFSLLRSQNTLKQPMSHNPRLTTSTGSVSIIIADSKLTRFGYRDYDACAGKWTPGALRCFTQWTI